MNDLRFTFRQLRKDPGFTAVAVLTLAICIGANLAIFSVIDAILVRSLPFPESDRLVVVHNAHPGAGIERGPATVANYFERRKSIKAFESVSMYWEESYTVGEFTSSQRVTCAQVTPEFFETLGVRLAMGEPFTDAHLDFGPNLVAILTDKFWGSHFGGDPDVLGRRIIINSENVLVISHRLWQRQFDGDPAIIGLTVPFRERPMAIVGVMPPHFSFPTPPRYTSA